MGIWTITGKFNNPIMAKVNVPTEQWRILAHATDFQVSNLGSVRNTERFNRAVATGSTPRNLAQVSNGAGYCSIKIQCVFGLKNMLVHRLVAFAFLGAPAEKSHVVNHKNLNKRDNRVENLEWISKSANVRHALEANGVRRARFTDARIREMRNRKANGESTSALAKVYGVNVTTLANIVKRVSYAGVA